MKSLKAGVAALALLGVASTAQANDNSGAYVNLGANALRVDVGVNVDFVSLSGKVGYNLNENLGFEVQGDIGMSGEFGAELDHFVGGFVVAKMPAGENFELFARGGVFTAQFSGGGATGAGEDFAAGVGGQFFFTENDGIRFEYTNLAFENAHMVGASYVRKF